MEIGFLGGQHFCGLAAINLKLIGTYPLVWGPKATTKTALPVLSKNLALTGLSPEGSEVVAMHDVANLHNPLRLFMSSGQWISCGQFPHFPNRWLEARPDQL